MPTFHFHSRLSVIAALAASAGLLACSKTEAPQAASVLRVVTLAEVQTGPDAPAIEAVGVLQNRDEARLGFKTGGVLQDIRVREGDRVKAGQVLAMLQTDEIDAGVAQAQEGLEKARRDLERGKRLFEQDVITKSQLEDLGTAEATARASVNAARFNRGTAQLTAPTDGVVIARMAEPREVVAPGQPVIVVGNEKQGMVIRVGLSDRQVVRVQTGDSVSVQLDALPDVTLEGRVVELAKSADPRIGTYRAEALLKPEQGDARRALSGMVGRARISAQSAGSASYIPTQSMLEGDQKSVWVFLATPSGTQKDGKPTYTVKRTPVEPLFMEGERVALKTPLPAGAQVVKQGAAFLNDGDTVTVP